MASITTSTVISQLWASVTSAFSLTLITEFGDRTFFIAALLATKYDKWAVLLGTLAALFLQSALAATLGRILKYLPSEGGGYWRDIPWDAYLGAAFLLFFAVWHLQEAFSVEAISPSIKAEDYYECAGDEEDPKSLVSGRTLSRRSTMRAEDMRKAQETVEKLTTSNLWEVVVKSFWLIFAAELGDKSMITTVALATAQNPFGVVIGAMGGHFVVTLIGVYAGAALHDCLSERLANLIAGVLFLIVGLLALGEGLSRQKLLSLAIL